MEQTRTKQTIRPLVAAISLAILVPGAALAADLPQLGKDPADKVVAALTLQEKVSLVTGQGMDFPGLSEDMQAPVVGATEDQVPGAAGTTFAVPRLGIPSVVMADGPAGVRIAPTRKDTPGQTFYATAFPIGSELATSWDVELVRKVGAAIGQQAREYGIDVMLTPAQNIHRYPLGGRNFEYYSEDPVVAGNMAAAMVQGIQSEGVAASIKHFAVNNHEWNRNTIDVKVDERALREVYLKGFEISVQQGQPWTVMSSYNKLNGTYTSENRWLLDDVLRQQWKYQGLVMTDWFGGKDAVAQMQAGNDLLMPGTSAQQKALLAAVREGTLDTQVLDRNVTRVLDLVLRTGTFKGVPHSDRPDLKTSAQVARSAAAQGMVLLKNEQDTLPLRTAAKVALLGDSSYQMITGGTGSGDVNKAYGVSLQQGLQAAGFGIDDALAKDYAHYLSVQTAKLPQTPWYLPKPRVPERAIDVVALDQLAQQQDVAVLTLGRASGEFVDRKAENDFELSQVERTLLQATAKAFHARGKKVVVVLNIGGVIETASWRDLADAIVLAWQPGQEAGHAIADVLSGKVNPSGKLADTFALKLQDYPAADGFPGKVLLGPDPKGKSLFGDVARAAQVDYTDGIWVGYRHFNTRDVGVAYPFGYGLSYTRFGYDGLKVDNRDDAGTVHASMRVTNTGKVAGREVVQVYVAAPHGTLDKPEEELRAFAKTGLLQPGQSQTLQFEIAGKDLASFDPALGRWVADPGTYQLRIGASSRDIRLKQDFAKRKPSQYVP
jgi:beta-glucosidase